MSLDNWKFDVLVTLGEIEIPKPHNPLSMQDRPTDWLLFYHQQ